MVAYLFILGVPCSGKSSIARDIVTYAGKQGVRATRVTDYNILQKMRCQDIDNTQFHSTEHDGFHVVEPSVYDEALKQLEKQIQGFYSKNRDLIVIEFARGNLVPALQLLDGKVLESASFLFVNTSISVCLERVQKRVLSRKTLDDHFVPEEVFKLYEGKDNINYLNHVANYLVKEIGVQPTNIFFIDNNTAWKDEEPVINQTDLIPVYMKVKKLKLVTASR